MSTLDSLVSCEQIELPAVDIGDERVTGAVRSCFLAECRAFAGGAFSSRYPSDRRYPQWDGGVDSLGRRHQNVWPKIVDFARRQVLDPLLLVRSRFATWVGSKPPAATTLYSQQAREAYRAYVTYRSASLGNTLKSETASLLGVYATFAASGQAGPVGMRIALLSNEANASALLRYSIAIAEGFGDIADLFLAAALRQYLVEQPLYDSAWQAVIPADLRRKAQTLRAD